MKSIDQLKTWKQHLRDNQARNIKNFRRYSRGECSVDTLSNYFEGRMTATANSLTIFDYMIEMEEICNGDT